MAGEGSRYCSLALSVSVLLFQMDGATTTLNWTVMIIVHLQISILGT